MKQKSRAIKSRLRTKNIRLAVVCSRFNEKICEGLLSGSLKALRESGFDDKHTMTLRVPGAFEIPLAAQRVAASKKYEGIVCLGAVIRGKTPHFDYICDAVTRGLTRVSLDYSIPVGFGVLTTNNLEEAVARSRPDDYNKGREAAFTVVEMVGLNYGQ